MAGRDSLGGLFTRVSVLRARHVGNGSMADLGSQVCSETCALSCTLPSGNSESQKSECRAYTKLFQALFHYFGHRTFRDGQMECLLPLLHVFAQMATGAGKSLCIFLGPLCSSRDAVGTVISRLTGVIEEQVPIIYY